MSAPKFPDSHYNNWSVERGRSDHKMKNCLNIFIRNYCLMSSIIVWFLDSNNIFFTISSIFVNYDIFFDKFRLWCNYFNLSFRLFDNNYLRAWLGIHHRCTWLSVHYLGAWLSVHHLSAWLSLHLHSWLNICNVLLVFHHFFFVFLIIMFLSNILSLLKHELKYKDS